MVLFFGFSELVYVDIQEDAIARARELEMLLDSLSRSRIGVEHEAYEFGVGKVFGGGRMLKLKNIVAWLGYRTFNPVLYGSLFLLMVTAAIIAPT